jgi:hypothetical protein
MFNSARVPGGILRKIPPERGAGRPETSQTTAVKTQFKLVFMGVLLGFISGEFFGFSPAQLNCAKFGGITGQLWNFRKRFGGMLYRTAAFAQL